MATNAQLITRLRQASKDTDPVRQKRTDATYAAMLTDAMTWLNEKLELCKKESSLTLAAETREYDVDAAFVKFPSDRLERQSGLVYWSTGNLKPTDPSLLDLEMEGWRNADSGTPEQFYLQSAAPSGTSLFKLGLVTKPDADFAAEFPLLTYYHVYRPTDVAADTNEPFDNNKRYRSLHRLLILYALWTIDVEDGSFQKAEERWNRFLQETEDAVDWIGNTFRQAGGLKFDKSWRR